MSKQQLKVGDRIEVTGTRLFMNRMLHKKGTITDMEDDEVIVLFDNNEQDNGYASEVRKITTRKPKMNYIVIWHEDEDPCEFFATIEEAKEKAAKLIKNEDGNDAHNIRIIKIESMWEVQQDIKITKVQ